MKQRLQVLSGFLVLAGLGWIIYFIARSLYTAFQSLQPTVAVAIVAGCTTIFGSVTALIVGRHFEAKRTREAVHREKKMELYDEFTQRLFTVFADSEKADGPEFVGFLREVQRKLVLWSGPKAVIAYATWHQILTTQGDNVRAESLVKMVDFFLALREDLGHSNNGIKRDHIAAFILKNSTLFMGMYRMNPDLLMSEVSAAEKNLGQMSKSV